MAIYSRATTANRQSAFRKSVDIRMKDSLNSKRQLYGPEDDFKYGIPNRPSTPIKSVMNNDYGMSAEMGIDKRYETIEKDIKKSK
mmetsp:Transcript_29092/g.21067  ORF Transcript_29092/g.21067 Transcript_29092/m.21067 type:complete len:85 (-) Transcript_29092:262-516(-)|eukprot:CAMPEP_0116883240 /NCGR_PEP_ID=MMETSP0463-20121206/15726_1 /TAXON_ID=181622 /ORGANISM="Strombidinopsis sp, Strain SopsisLIS2011" /LENGTH=84 /DNA_ID=CAMNT_0004537735 /DNA_START=211 /DNA_END=465 /DNA_ORIENTATION=+